MAERHQERQPDQADQPDQTDFRAPHRVATPEMPAEHAILGLLLLDDGTGHGYDLARHFGDGRPLGSVLRLEPGMLYHHLKKLARAGWVTSTVEPQGSRPPRQVYQITSAGREELLRWLREPVTRTREIRLEFLVKLFFARRLDPALARRLVDEQRTILHGLEASLAAQMAQPAPPDTDDAEFMQRVTELRLEQTRAALNWLDQVDDRESDQ
jgi:PadR family transcriptional regulator AphA